MKRFVVCAVLGCVLVVGYANANQINDIADSRVQTISQDDANLLFNNIETSKVVVLDSTEMNETKGRFLLGFLFMKYMPWEKISPPFIWPI